MRIPSWVTGKYGGGLKEKVAGLEASMLECPRVKTLVVHDLLRPLLGEDLFSEEDEEEEGATVVVAVVVAGGVW